MATVTTTGPTADRPTGTTGAGPAGSTKAVTPIGLFAGLDRRMLTLIGVMCVVAAGYPSYVAHPVTLVAPVPLLVALVVLDEGRLRAPIWLVLVGATMVWTALLYLAMATTGNGLLHGLAMYAPFAVLAFRVRRSEQIAMALAVGTATLLCLRVIASWLNAGAAWAPWQVYEGNEMSARLNMLLPLVLVARFAVPRERTTVRALLLGLLATGALSVVLAQQRAGLGMLALLIVIGLVRTDWRWLFALAAAAAAAWLVAKAAIVDVLERVRLVNFTPSNATRPEIWDLAIDATRRTSWLGVGPGGSADALRQFDDVHAHNNVVQTMLELGWPGALAAAAMTTYLVVMAARLLYRGGEHTFWALPLIAYVGFAVVSAPIVRPDFTLVLLLVVMGARDRLARPRPT